MNIAVFLVVVALSLSLSVQGYRVLVVFPVPVRSMNLLGDGMVRHLLAAGHEVTHVSVFPMQTAPGSGSSYRHIHLEENLAALSDEHEQTIAQILEGSLAVNDVTYLQKVCVTFAELTFSNQSFQRLLRDPSEQFDVVLADLYESEVYAGLAALYRCPLVWAYSMGVHWQVLRLLDVPPSPAYSADYLSSNVPPFSFVQRVQELWARIRWTLEKERVQRVPRPTLSTLPMEAALYERVFAPLVALRGAPLPAYRQLLYNASLVLSNEFVLAGDVPATPQNFQLVGGQHIPVPTEPLPEELQTLMDNAKHGVIYFSMGSTWKSKGIPPALTRGLLDMFGTLRQTVIWKYEAELQDLPPNVHTVQWAPQHSVLAHPKCLLFITHGGILSSIEAVHFAKPIIGVPIYFDQFLNTNRAVSNGYAVKVDLTYELPGDLRAAIRQVLGDTRYRERARELSALYHATPLPRGRWLAHWVELAARTRGAAHLRSPAPALPWHRRCYLDLAALLALLLAALLLAARRLAAGSAQRCDVVKKDR